MTCSFLATAVKRYSRSNRRLETLKWITPAWFGPWPHSWHPVGTPACRSCNPAVCDWLSPWWGGGAFICQLSPPSCCLSGVWRRGEGPLSVSHRVGKIEGGERTTWRPTWGTKAGSRWKQVSVCFYGLYWQLIVFIENQCNDRFIFVSLGVALHPCTCASSSSIL